MWSTTQWVFQVNHLGTSVQTAAPAEFSHPALESRILVGYVAALSAFALGARRLRYTRMGERLYSRVFGPEERALDADYIPEGGYVIRHGGPFILSCQVLRLAANAALAVAALLEFLRDRHAPIIAILLAAVYASFLSAVLLIVPISQSHRFATHSTVSGLAIFLCYSYRDIWPLLTYILNPADGSDGFVWAVLAFSSVSSVLVPVCEPRPYIPYDPSSPQSVPSAEQTTSLLGLFSYAFQDALVSTARREGHLEPEQLPSQLDTDQLAVLTTTAYPYLDPFHNGARRRIRVLWGLLLAFRSRWASEITLLLLGAILQLGAPVGTNRLLAHVEVHGAGKLVRSGVWIAWIALAPILAAVMQQMQMHVNQRTLIRLEAVLTALVHEHALRVRVLHHVDEEQDSSISNKSIPSTPATVEQDESADQIESLAVATESRSESRATETTAVSSSDAPLEGVANTADVQSCEKKQDIVGRLTTLVTADMANIASGGDFLNALVKAPLIVSLASAFLISLLGTAAWVGLAVMLTLLPMTAWVSRAIAGLQKKGMEATDARVKTVKETLNMLRMVKQHGWEMELQRQIAALRSEELRWSFRAKLYNLVTNCINNVISLSHIFVTFGYFTLVEQKALTMSIVFPALTGFTMLRSTIFDLMWDVSTLTQAYISIGRIQEFFNDAEVLDCYAPDGFADITSSHVGAFGMANMSFAWSATAASDSLASAPAAFRLRIKESLIFKPALNLIIGPTGCGKSSLLLALLGEMHCVPAERGAWINVPRGRGLAYCAQESWVQSMSIRDNILFGSVYEAERYRKVLYQCGLHQDLAQFEARDHTEVGEKGITLSGGQKARVALARAVYSSANTLLVDDVLAALDVHTAVWIVNKCLNGDLIHGRTVLLVSHNVPLLAPLAASVISMGAGGRVLSVGPPKDNILRDHIMTNQLAHEQTVLEEEPEGELVDQGRPIGTEDTKLVIPEDVQRGSIGWDAFKLYFSALSRYPVLYAATCIVIASLCESSVVGQYLWLGQWTRAYEKGGDVNSARYLGLYFAIIMITIVAFGFCVILTTFGSVRASRIVHARLMASIVTSTFRWLDQTPMSRILTRCTADIQAVDGPLAQLWFALLMVGVLAGSRIIAIVVSSPLFLFPSLMIGVTGGVIGRMYMATQLSVQRLRSNAKAPVVAAVNDTFAGLASIRAFGAQGAFRRECAGRINEYNRLSMTWQTLSRWIAVRMQVLSSLFSGGLAVYLLYGPGSASRTAATIGFQLVMAVDFTRVILNIVQLLNNFEVQSNSLERIQSYIDIEHEPEPKHGGTPPAYWPTSGDIRVENLTVRYSLDGPAVLHDISFHIKAGQRIGVVGRTGSGKSTLTLALLRCILTEGEVYYDGVPTSSINLDALRSNITIIPQAPELLTSTLRKNLDIFGQHDDAELNAALRYAGLFALQANSDQSRLTLDSEIAAGGGNLSVGQRQIVALARAIVRESKVLILDEATSAIDYKTDTIIQKSLRTELKRDVTVLTVAHRLRTVLDADKIMVLDSGKIAEFDAPAELMKDKNGLLRALVDESADKEELYAMVEGVDMS